MKAIWTGTDSLFLVRFPKQLKKTKIFYVLALRLFARITDFFAQEHYSCGELVENNLRKFGMKKKIAQFEDILWYPDKIEKKPHEGINVLYYYPKKDTKFNRWLYGKDVFEKIRFYVDRYCENVNFIVVDGTANMKEIYPIVDILIRPNRHDGHPRMVDECSLNGIKVFSTKENPYFAEFFEKIVCHENIRLRK